MRRCRVIAAFAAAMAGGALGIAACSSDEPAATRPPERDGASGDERTTLVEGSAPIDELGNDAGVLTVVDEPDTPCTRYAGAPRQLYDEDAGATLHTIVGVGGRFAGRTDDGFVLFDREADAGRVDPPVRPEAFVRMGSLGDSLVAIGVPSFITASRYDATGARRSGDYPVTLGASPSIDVAGADGGALVAWLGSSAIMTRALGPSGPQGAEITMRASLSETTKVLISVAPAGNGEYGVAYTAQSLDGTQSRLGFGRVSASGVVGRTYTLDVSATPKRVVQLARVTGGFALLFELGSESTPHVMMLDEAGRITGPARKLLGTLAGFGIAGSGDEVGVLAWRGSRGADAGHLDAVEFRPFARSGAPVGSWICLDGPSGYDPQLAAAITGEPNGYAAVYRTPERGVALAVFDRRGTGQ